LRESKISTRELPVVVAPFSNRELSVDVSTRELPVVVSTREPPVVVSTRTPVVVASFSNRELPVDVSTRELPVVVSTRELPVVVASFSNRDTRVVVVVVVLPPMASFWFSDLAEFSARFAAPIVRVLASPDASSC